MYNGIYVHSPVNTILIVVFKRTNITQLQHPNSWERQFLFLNTGFSRTMVIKLNYLLPFTVADALIRFTVGLQPQ